LRRRHGLIWYWNRVKTYVGRPRMIVQTKPVVIGDDDRCESPIFIVGAHRSGTSLVRRLFNSHREIACPPESFFIANYAAMLDDRFVGAGYEAFGYSAEEARADIARKASELHEAYRIATGKSIWADKTPAVHRPSRSDRPALWRQGPVRAGAASPRRHRPFDLQARLALQRHCGRLRKRASSRQAKHRQPAGV
jgi:hypothetical protein